MLRLKHCSNYVTPPSWQTSRPQQKYSMDVQHRVQFFQDHLRRSIYVRSARDLLCCKRNKKNSSIEPIKPEIYVLWRCKNESSSSNTSKPQAPSNGQQVLWLRYSNVDDPTWSEAPTAESTEGIELIWSPFVMMAPPFKTIQWWKGKNSPKTIPFKTIRPARPDPCLSTTKWAT